MVWFSKFDIIKLTKTSTTFTDNFVCELHHSTTKWFLVACQILALAYDFFGDPVICTNHEDWREKLLNWWCWNQGVYTVPSGGSLADPDVPWKATKKHHAWYKWSWVMFLAQALLFYVPRYIWKNWEGGKLDSLLKYEKDDKTDQNKIILGGGSLIDVVKLAKKFHKTFHSHGLYAAKLFFCEVLNLVNVVGQLFWMDFILGGKFLSHGPQYIMELMRRSSISFTERMKSQTDLIYQVFPRLAKCHFYVVGPGGESELKDSLCMLSINNANEKIFIFLWFWMYVLTLITIIHIFWRILQLISPVIRKSALFGELNFCRPGSSLQYIRQNLPSEDLQYVLQKCYFGDWFLLYQLAKHFTNPEGFHAFILELRKRLDNPQMDEIVFSTLEVTEVIKEKTKEQNKNSVLNSEEINYVKVMA